MRMHDKPVYSNNRVLLKISATVNLILATLRDTLVIHGEETQTRERITQRGAVIGA